MVRVDVNGIRGVIEVDRPAGRNALDGDGWRAITAAVARLNDDRTVRVVVLQSTGSVFCAGGDVDWMRGADSDELALIGAAVDALAGSTKPTVARVQGPAYGGGVGLAAACDLVVAAPTARFTMSEVRLGIAPAIISRAVIRRVGPARFRSWALTAQPIDAPTALAAGLVDRLADAEKLDAVVADLLGALSAGEPTALSAVKAIPTDGLDADEAARVLARLRDRPEFAEGVAALREKRPTSWTCRICP